MRTSSIKKQVSVMMVVIGVVAIALFALLASNNMNTSKVHSVENQAQELIARAAQMFMVSTTKFNEQYTAESDPEKKKALHDDWNRTIEAVDIAVTTDFGSEQSRVRLFSDPKYVQAERLGKDETLAKGNFELEALQRFTRGEAEFVYMDDSVYKLAVPMFSDMHPGCANCHEIEVGKHEFLGGVSAAIPMTKLNEATSQTILIITLFVSATLLILLILIYLFLGKQVINPLSLLSNQSETISKAIEAGDVNHQVSSKGNLEIISLTENFNGMLGVVKRLFENLTSNSGYVYQAAEKTADMAQSQQQIAMQQQDNIQAIVTALTELQSAGDMVSSRAVNTAETSDEVNRFVNESRETMDTAVEEITVLASEVDRASQVIKSLDQRSDSIGSIISTIDGIAEQTNLLALNAAIEAARAGEQGRGFAVVADEVRTLAQSTQSATSEIKQLIQNLQSDARTASSVMESSTEKVVSTVDATQLAQSKLDEITKQVSQINDMNRDIAAASEQQVVTIADINSNLHAVSEITQNSVNAAQSMSEESESLKQLSKEMVQ